MSGALSSQERRLEPTRAGSDKEHGLNSNISPALVAGPVPSHVQSNVIDPMVLGGGQRSKLGEGCIHGEGKDSEPSTKCSFYCAMLLPEADYLKKNSAIKTKPHRSPVPPHPAGKGQTPLAGGPELEVPFSGKALG